MATRHGPHLGVGAVLRVATPEREDLVPTRLGDGCFQILGRSLGQEPLYGSGRAYDAYMRSSRS